MSLDLAKIHILPCFQPVHRKEPTASPEARLAMVQCAVMQEPKLVADDREIKRQNPSYMIDTSCHFEQKCQKHHFVCY